MAMSRDQAFELLEAVYSPEEIEKLKEEKQADAEQRIADARIFFEVFGNGRGPELLEILKHKTVYASTMSRGSAIIEGDIPLNPGEFMAFREGQNALVRFIERQMKISQETI